MNCLKYLLMMIGVWTMTAESGYGQVSKEGHQEGSAFRYRVESLDGSEIDLAKYKGKVTVIVNVASKCGFTPQYEQLQALHTRYAEKGLAILGFPCNQFLWQEPGSADEIGEFCRVNYGVTFDMFAKVKVNGKNACQLYRFLTSQDTKPKHAGKIGWNFEKFILDRDGLVVARFGSSTKPDSPEIVAVIERELARSAATD